MNDFIKIKIDRLNNGETIETSEKGNSMVSPCGALKEDLKLSDRTYICDCGISIDRDLNASINLRNKFMSVEYIDYRRGETVRPVRIVYDPKGSFYEASTEIKEVCA